MNQGNDIDHDKEHQMAAEGSGAGRDPEVIVYRRIFEILREPLPVELPPDFSAKVARLAMSGAQAPADRADRLPGGLLQAALGALLIWSSGPQLIGLVTGIVKGQAAPGALLLAQAAVALGLASALHVAVHRLRRRGRPASG